MRKLIKHSLNSIHVLSYFKDRMDGGNKLTEVLLKNIDLSRGNFYTLLTKEAVLSKIYKFEQGGILPAYPTEEVYIDNLGTYQAEKINSIDKEIALLINEKMQQNEYFSCILDDVSATYHKNYKDFLFLSHGIFYKKEVYYFITKETVSINIINECLTASNSFWHFLCILTETDFNNNNKELTLNEMQEICQKTKIIIVDAYDREGYVFWEKINNN